MSPPVVVVGASAVALDVLDIATALRRDVVGLVDETRRVEPGETILNIPVFGSLVEALQFKRATRLVVAVGDNHDRSIVADRVLASGISMELESLVHPDASVSQFASVGAGAIVMAGCRIASGAIVGRLAYLQANTVISHECVLGESVSCGAGAALAGRVQIGDRTMIGMNASVREGTTTGSDVLVGAGSFVNDDILDCTVVAGVPARRLRSRTKGERYLR